MSFTVIIALIMIIIIVILLVKGFAHPGIIFATVPVIAAIVLGYSAGDIENMLRLGLGKVSTSLTIMIFAVMFFGVVGDAGVLNWLVQVIMKRLGNSVTGVLIITTILCFATQLDGSGASTALCTIPTMKPIYDKMKIRREALVMLEGFSAGTLTLLPWAPGFVEAATFADVAVYDLFIYMIPALIFSMVLLVANCFFVGYKEKKNGAGMSDEEFKAVRDEILNKKIEFPLGKKIALFDGVLSLAIMAILIAGLARGTSLFLFAFPIILLVNYRSNKDQRAFIKRNSAICINLTITMLGLAMMLGVFDKTNALGELATLLTSNFPTAFISYIPIILCLFGVPIGIILGNAVRAMVVPAVIAIVAVTGVGGLAVAGPALLCANICVNMHLGSAPAYMACGLADIEFNSNLKYGFLNCWALSVVITIFMVIAGQLPF